MAHPLSIKLAAVAALATLAVAMPAQACRLMVAPDPYWTEATGEDAAVAIARVTATRPHTKAELAELHSGGATAPGGSLAISDNSGHVDLRLVTALRGDVPAAFSATYDSGPSCGYNWTPQIGESVLAIVHRDGWVEVWPFLGAPVSER
ncbi:MAG: hypothetical protein JWR84_986 [Caulobacter sp.]|nr:hypothetical protein [Caulobacter sp.]